MKPVDRYIQDVMTYVFAAPEERQRFEADLRAHFADAETRGESPPRIIDDMGKPEDVAAAFNAEREIRYAGFMQRLIAFVGDIGVMLALASVPIGLALLFSSVSLGDLSPGPRPVVEVWVVEPSLAVVIGLVASGLAFVGIALFYFPLLEWRFGKTLGKHLMRIRVIRETGSPIGLGQAFVRRLSFYFEMLVIDALFVPFTDKKQRALDIIAKTVVAREPGAEAKWWGWAVCLMLPVVSLMALAAIAGLWPNG